MWKIQLCIALVAFLMAFVRADYSIAASAYHYPAPPKSQQLYDPVSNHQGAYAAPQVYQNQYQGNYYSSVLIQQSPAITKQFASPVLDNAAFNLALRNQGYTFGKAPAFNAALTANARSSKTALKKATASSSPSSHSTSSSLTPVIGSLNVKLPLPIGVTPLNIGPLPLQAGTPYASIPNGVTSYGTIYPQRKRR